MSEKLIVSWDEYNKTVEKLAIQIDESGYKPTILIGIMRGAAPMIDVLSRIFKLKCAYLAVESYSGKGVEDEQGDFVFSREMSSIAPNMGGKILLCDDLSDTGLTFNKSIDWLKKYEPIKNKIEDIKTATLFKKMFLGHKRGWGRSVGTHFETTERPPPGTHFDKFWGCGGEPPPRE